MADLGPRLDIRQSQSLVMTPQLQQAIKLLQMSHTELAGFVESELEQNPMLERDEGQADPLRNAAEQPSTEIQDAAPSENAQDFDSSDLLGSGNISGDGQDTPLDADYGNTYDGDYAGAGAVEGGGYESSLLYNGTGSGGRSDFSDDVSSLEATLSENKSLGDHLIEQMQMSNLGNAEKMVALYLIDYLDDSGWLTGDLKDAADNLGCNLELVETVLETLQQFDPPGVFARDLKECLALQLKDQNRYDPAMERLLNNLHLLANQDARALKRLCGVDDEDLLEMVAEIRALNPKPALEFDTIVAEPVIPDVLMRPTPEGGWRIDLNSETLPRVLVNESYYGTISAVARSKDDKDYLNERFQTANWLVKSLHQRAQTIMKVSTELVRQQDGFFRYGVSHLKPLVLRDIAEAIEMHESTVSRVTSNKYIATPRGIFELKYFFTSAISSTNSFGESHSAESVKHSIKKLIDAEDPKKVLSDDKIVAILKGEGMDIARRTVAKYREAMNIPSSVQRRRQKKKKL
ncbi:RNA polymerase factor sigma-54 [Curvivirga aplysinae]|uniref:RNA polymerase factor sigma-54 n=1 Tax=Curvivirga aplysinae TaxID=2529852 RepID=UPI0012BC7B8C|nr:RNA polymerase factor sigma-54 [Curvivirga aplysinae]MTI10459.1 RNA polymerase sigma-54 factor [Curvivirga aplysinae]